MRSRLGSAWLIRRFIDADARFEFAADRDALPAVDAIPFDMFGVEFSHQGEGCTFETLCTVFGIMDLAVARIAQIVHDLDLKDGRFGAPDAATVGTLIEGLQLATAEDDLLLERGGSRSSSRCIGRLRNRRGPQAHGPSQSPAPARPRPERAIGPRPGGARGDGSRDARCLPLAEANKTRMRVDVARCSHA